MNNKTIGKAKAAKKLSKREKLVKHIAARVLDYDWGELYAEQFAEWVIGEVMATLAKKKKVKK